MKHSTTSSAILTETDTKQLAEIAQTIRGLSMDAVEAAGCGHPGLPLGCAEIGAYLFAKVLRYNPKSPNWINRDRFVLSAGHGSMLLYSLLHLSGYDVTLDDLKQFRQMGSRTPGHPEYRELPGVETTTGPLGQGLATATGMALGQRMMAAVFDVDQDGLLDATVYVLASDGCMMEGISAEAASLAGHLKLGNLIVIYDSNDICLDGPTSECFSEDVEKRYLSYGWDVSVIDGHSFDDLSTSISQAQSTSEKPSLIIAKTVIGNGAPNLSGTSDIHGKAMGKEEVELTKQACHIPLTPLFYVPDAVKAYFEQRVQDGVVQEQSWINKFDAWTKRHPDLATKWDIYLQKKLPADIQAQLAAYEISPNGATRQSSHAVLQFLNTHVPYLIGGSADLSCSDSTMMKNGGIVGPGQFLGRNIKYGVREHAMAAMNSGLALQGMMVPYCGTFLQFSDYMRGALRLSALMSLKVLYQFTHDSVFLGEDGPTHQPVEHLVSLRAIPNLVVIRPADTTEVKGAWLLALQQSRPVVFILSRQKVPDLSETTIEGVFRGGYILKEFGEGKRDFCLLATGSEVSLALAVADELHNQGRSVRVVSVPSTEIFDEQEKSYQDAVLGDAAQYVSIEAQSSLSWYKYIGRHGIAISVDSFGCSANLSDIKTQFGFTVPQVLKRLL